MKVLFLDIDGVLNCDTTKEKLGPDFGIYAAFMGLDARLVAMLKEWLARFPEVKVVLSSTWRLDERMAAEVKRQGIDFIDMTKNLKNRAIEVDEWLNRHPEVTHYAILDDIRQFNGPQQRKFVQTSFVHGLRPKNLGTLAAILDL